MKLATYRDGSRDGQLVVVAADLASAHYASGIATRLQQVLDDWNFIAPQLHDLAQALERGKARHAFAFDPARCMAPLPRAFEFAGGSAFSSHVERMHGPGAAGLPERLRSEPRMMLRAAGELLGARDDIVARSEDDGIDFEAEVAVVTGDIAMGSGADATLEGIRLLVLGSGVNLRHLAPAEPATDIGSIHSKPATAFSPVAVTPDELGEAWRGGRIHRELDSVWNGQRIGRCHAGTDMTFHFGTLIAHLGRTRNVRAGTIVSSGAVSNHDASRGCSCLAERRAIETITSGAPSTRLMRHGDSVHVEMLDDQGRSVFGAIEQHVAVRGRGAADRGTAPA